MSAADWKFWAWKPKPEPDKLELDWDGLQSLLLGLGWELVPTGSKTVLDACASLELSTLKAYMSSTPFRVVAKAELLRRKK